MLVVKDLVVGYTAEKPIVSDVSFTLDDGEFCCIVGANGCGKTTVLKTILGLLKRIDGSVLVNGSETLDMSERERAHRFAYIPQMHRLPFPFKVKDIVLMGRTSHMSRLSSVSAGDKRIAYAAMCHLCIQDLANARYSELSGGQQQLVLIARALCQQPDILVMDEPTASLDFGNQQLVLSRMRSLVDSGMSVLMVTHDPAHAFYCADKVVAINKGHVLDIGTPVDVITPETMHAIYGTEVLIDRVDVGAGKSAAVCVPVLQSHDVDEFILRELTERTN